jgi:hypothetical protein
MRQWCWSFLPRDLESGLRDLEYSRPVLITSGLPAVPAFFTPSGSVTDLLSSRRRFRL